MALAAEGQAPEIDRVRVCSVWSDWAPAGLGSAPASRTIAPRAAGASVHFVVIIVLLAEMIRGVRTFSPSTNRSAGFRQSPFAGAPRLGGYSLMWNTGADTHPRIAVDPRDHVNDV